ncbi:unnamed protein product [Rhizopus stolonifer]
MFIKSLRNLVDVQMKNQGAFPLGEFYIFPNNKELKEESSETNILTSSLCCTYNVYLANTNLIFQPNTRRMRLKPVAHQPNRMRGKKAIISPSGECVTITSNNYYLPKQTEETVLKRWSSLLDIPYTSLVQHDILKPTQSQEQKLEQPHTNQQLPSLISLKSIDNNTIFYYPTVLVFVSSSSKMSPTDMAGTNGLFKFNQGFSENLGDKWNRSAWNEKIANLWEFVCPKDDVVSSVLDMLSQEHSTINQAGFLQKVMHESTNNASPLMVTTSMATPASANGNQQRADSSISSTPVAYQEENEEKSKPKNQQSMSLAEFAIANFGLSETNNGDILEYPQQYVNNYTNGPIVSNHGTPIPQPQPIQQSIHLTQVEPMKLEDLPTTMQSNGLLPVVGHTTNNSTYHSPQMTNLELDPFGLGNSMGVDDMMLDIPDRWNDDTMGDLENFDLGVTEEDFDFFQSGPVNANTKPVIISGKNEMFMDDSNTDSLMLMDTDTNQENIDEDFDMLDKDKILVLNDKDMVMMDSDMENATAGIHDLAVAPLQVGMPQQGNGLFQEDQRMDSGLLHKQLSIYQQIPSDESKFPHNVPKQRELFIPPTFAPVKVNFMVNDSKYLSGGKFTYPFVNQDNALNTQLQKNSFYSPDYVPKSRSKKQRKRKSLRTTKALEDDMDVEPNNSTLETIKGPLVQNIESTTNLGEMHENKHGNTTDASIIGNNGNISSCSSYSSSDYNSSSCDENDYSDDDIISKPNRILDYVSLAQDSFIEKLITSPYFRRSGNRIVDQTPYEYDSPFADAVADSYSKSNRQITITNIEDYKALDYLCQQAVLGGYPFSGGAESVSSNGVEANEGESTKAVISRRRNLLQKFHGDTIHTCSTPHDTEYMNQSFKNVLNSIFTKKDPDMNPMCMDQPLLPAPVTVKGPLNVQQYYDLSETSQAHSKYGKYQVKRRRPAEPNLDVLRPPNIVVNRQEEFIEGTTKLVMFWEKLRLEPYSCKKPINYFVVYPENELIERNTSQFFRNLGTLYETCQLGSHNPGNIGPYRKGLVPVPLLPAVKDETLEDQQIRSYQAECQNLGSVLGNAVGDGVYNVVYMVNPSSDLLSNVYMTRCFNKLVEAYDATVLNTRTKTSGTKPIVQLVPAEHILRSSSFGGCLKFGLKEIAFSVYSKCHAMVTRSRSNNELGGSSSAAEIYAPPFVLPRLVPNTVQYSIKKALTPFPNILENNAVLHLGYCFSFDKRWMIVVWTDNNGELIEFATIDRQLHNLSTAHMFEEAWRRTKSISKRTGFVWTFVIAKIGLLFEKELRVWLNCTGSEERVAIVCLDLESPLNISSVPSTSTVESPTLPTAMDSINSNVPGLVNSANSIGNMGAGINNKKPIYPVDDHGLDQTKALLLNHRVAYSSKRERASLAMLNMDPSSNTENWMIPLASGYMIHTPSPTENTRHGLFNCNPPVIEIHLVFNQTNHSAYSTLRDIIQKYHALSYVNILSSNNNRFPIHLALAERLSRILLVVNT